MKMRRTIGVLIVLLTFAGPDLLACGDKFLFAARFTRYQRPRNARSASVLIYNPASTMAGKSTGVDIESVVRRGGHRPSKVKTLQELSQRLLNGHYDVVLASNSDSATVQGLLPSSPDAAIVMPIDDLVKNYSLLAEIDRRVVQRDKDLKKTDQNLKKAKK